MKNSTVEVKFSHNAVKVALRCELTAQGYDVPPAEKCRLTYDMSSSTKTATLSWKEE